MPNPLSYNKLKQSERMLIDLIDSCVAHYAKRGRSVRVVYLSKNMWQVWLSIYKRAYTEQEWEERKDEAWYLDEHMATEVKEGTPLQIHKIQWELWPLKPAEA